MPMTSFLRNSAGVAAIEFAVLAPAFVMLLVGTMTVGLLLFSASGLHFATEAAARCASVQATLCHDAPTTNAFAAAKFFGSAHAAVFTCTGRVCGGIATCGNLVTGTVTVTLDVGVASYSVPLHASACYP